MVETEEEEEEEVKGGVGLRRRSLFLTLLNVVLRHEVSRLKSYLFSSRRFDFDVGHLLEESNEKTNDKNNKKKSKNQSSRGE